MAAVILSGLNTGLIQSGVFGSGAQIGNLFFSFSNKNKQKKILFFQKFNRKKKKIKKIKKNI